MTLPNSNGHKSFYNSITGIELLNRMSERFQLVNVRMKLIKFLWICVNNFSLDDSGYLALVESTRLTRRSLGKVFM